jgi:hypothetical protein
MLWTRRLSCISQLTAARAKRRSEGRNGGCLDRCEIVWGRHSSRRCALRGPLGTGLGHTAKWLAVLVLTAVAAVAALAFIPSQLAGVQDPQASC